MSSHAEEAGPMTRAHKTANLIGVVLPPLMLVVAIVLLWNRAIGWVELTLMLGMYLLTGFGITIGFHRLLTHRAFKTFSGVRAVFAVLGSMAVEGPVIRWVADHRKHHTYTDREGDPHSPHVDRKPGIVGAFKGLFHAHIGWLFRNHGRADLSRFAPDLTRAKEVVFVHRTFWLWAILSFVIPAALGWLLTGSWVGAITGLIWGGFVRMLMLHHMTWSINSICHFFGRQRFPTGDESRNVFWLAPFSFGEAWHHNHHAFPTSAFHGLRRSERMFDPGAYIIWTLEKFGLAWDVVRISPERQEARLAGD